MKESKLILLCKNNLYKQVTELFLEKLPEPINILYENGLAIRLAIKNNNFPLLVSLIDYYLRETLKKYRFDTTDYNISKHRLKEIIGDALESFDASKEILSFLKTKELLPEEPDDCIYNLFGESLQRLKWAKEHQEDPNDGIKANAYYILSRYYRYGWANVTSNVEFANKYLEESANLGHTQACYDIARIFFDYGNSDKALFYINKGLTRINDHDFDCAVISHSQNAMKHDLESLVMICDYIKQQAKSSERNSPKLTV